MTLFEFTDYKKFLQKMISTQSKNKGYQTKLADAAGCQRAFISQVLHGKAHFTFDHAVALCEYWNFRELETQYFFELLQLAKAATPQLRSYCLKKLDLLKTEHSDLSIKFKSTGKLTEKQQSKYYSNWIYPAIHVLTSIVAYQTEKSIAAKMSLTVHQVQSVLNELEGMQLVVKNRSGHWKPSERNLFLPRQSHMTFMHHSNWRFKALTDIQEEKQDSIHYSTLHALSFQDVERLKEMILSFLTESKKLVEPSLEEEIVCLNLDFFKL